ncbi:MAG TPA: hypothetical protein VFV99_08315, partial [Kofleriaceae bacterium]|nr:hypothetical protein [Kofleriaceae bacterium]
EERATAITVDAIGNVVVAGTCDGVVDFGMTRADCHGSFITKRAYDTGAELWTHVLPNAQVSSVSVDDLGYTIANGSYTGTLEIGGSQFTATGNDPFVVGIDPTGGIDGGAALGLVGTAVSPVGTIEPDGCIYMTGGFHGTMPTPDGTMTNQTGELDGYVSGHYADMNGAWMMRFGGERDQVGRALAVQGEHLAVLAETGAPLHVADQVVSAPAWPASVLMQFSIVGQLQWTRVVPDPSTHLAVARDNSIVVAGIGDACTRLHTYDVAGAVQWTSECTPLLSTDAIAIGVDGTIVTGGRNFDPTSGELFLAAHDGNGAPIGHVNAQPYPAFERDSSLDGIAIEPSGEVAFIATINHPFDFGNGMLAFSGAHDAVIVKLDSPTGHDGPVVLLRK